MRNEHAVETDTKLLLRHLNENKIRQQQYDDLVFRRAPAQQRWTLHADIVRTMLIEINIAQRLGKKDILEACGV